MKKEPRKTTPTFLLGLPLLVNARQAKRIWVISKPVASSIGRRKRSIGVSKGEKYRLENGLFLQQAASILDGQDTLHTRGLRNELVKKSVGDREA